MTVDGLSNYAPEDDVPDDWRPADTDRWSRVELLAEIDALNECVAKWVGIAIERKGAVDVLRGVLSGRVVLDETEGGEPILLDLATDPATVVRIDCLGERS